MDPLAGRYDTAMDKDIYDVFRLLVNAVAKAGTLIDTDAAEALAIIDKHAEAAQAPAPAPAKPEAKPEPATWTPRA